jgi:phage terminase large subunit-like protein
VPLHDLKEIGFAGSDPRLLFSWYSADRCTDPNFAACDPEQRANPSMASWPEGRAYLEQQRRRLPPSIYRRLHLNLGGSENAFIDLAAWDACTDLSARPVLFDRALPIWVGVDASMKHDSTAIVAVTRDASTQKVRLVWHRIFEPTPVEPVDFEAMVEATVLDLNKRFRVIAVKTDPWQMQAVAQRLQRAGVRVEEFPQSPGNLTIASQNLYELIEGRNLLLYPRCGDTFGGLACGRH